MANSFDTELETPELESLSSLAQHLVYRLPECDDATIRLTLREVYRDFCRRACCLRVRRHFHGPCCHIPVAFGGTVLQVTEVWSGTHRLRAGREFTCAGSNVMIPHHRCDDVVIAWVEIPPLSCEEAPQWILDKYGDALCSGALARLLAQPNRPWSDQQMAVAESQRYEAAVGEERQNLYTESPAGSLGTVFDTSDMI